MHGDIKFPPFDATLKHCKHNDISMCRAKCTSEHDHDCGLNVKCYLVVEIILTD